MNRSLPGRSLAAAAATLLAAAACGKDGPAGPAAAYVGAWTGTTSQGYIFNFYVTDEGIVLAVVQFQVVGTSCTAGRIVFYPRISPGPPYAIADDSFSVQTGFSGGTVDFAGAFTASNQASGTLAVDATTCGGSISATWTATKATGPEVVFAGNWDGMFQSNLTSTTITLSLTQNGANLSGSFAGPNGLMGNVSGTVDGAFASFRLTETTQGCPGRFDGYAMLYEGPPEFIFFALAGSNCLGTHQGAAGFADPA
jgi:hypothetical protein